jgi:hypothetical protein
VLDSEEEQLNFPEIDSKSPHSKQPRCVSPRTPYIDLADKIEEDKKRCQIEYDETLARTYNSINYSVDLNDNSVQSNDITTDSLSVLDKNIAQMVNESGELLLWFEEMLR